MPRGLIMQVKQHNQLNFKLGNLLISCFQIKSKMCIVKPDLSNAVIQHQEQIDRCDRLFNTFEYLIGVYASLQCTFKWLSFFSPSFSFKIKCKKGYVNQEGWPKSRIGEERKSRVRERKKRFSNSRNNVMHTIKVGLPVGILELERSAFRRTKVFYTEEEAAASLQSHSLFEILW